MSEYTLVGCLQSKCPWNPPVQRVKTKPTSALVKLPRAERTGLGGQVWYLSNSFMTKRYSPAPHLNPKQHISIQPFQSRTGEEGSEALKVSAELSKVARDQTGKISC